MKKKDAFQTMWEPIKQYRVEELIAAIEKSQAIYMPTYHSYNYLASDNSAGSLSPACSINDLHPCGNRACIMGHTALLPSFKQLGGKYSKIYGGTVCYPYGNSIEIAGHVAFCYWFFGRVREPEFCACYMLIHGAGLYSGWMKWDWQDAIAALQIFRHWKDFSVQGQLKLKAQLSKIRPDEEGFN